MPPCRPSWKACKPWFCSSGKQEGQGSKRTRTTPCASETGHFLFFSGKNTHPGKTACQIDEIWSNFDDFWSKFDPKCSGPAFFVEILARPKIWRLVSTKRKILRLVSTRRQVLTGMCQICERVVSGNPRNLRDSERMDRYSLPYRCQNPSCQRHVWGMMTIGAK